MLPQQVVPLRHELLECREPVRRITPPREKAQLQPPLVVLVDRLPELLRVGRVNEDRNPEARARLPYRVQCRIIDAEASAVTLRDREAEAFRDLADTDRSRRDVGFELRHRLLRPSRTDVAEVDTGED